MIFLDTNVISESARPAPNPKIIHWIDANEASLALSTVALAEIAFGIARTREAERAKRLSGFIKETRLHFVGRIYPFDEEAAMIYGDIMGSASRMGRPVSVPDGMIAAIALRHNASLATRNISDFEIPNLKTVNPWA